MAFKSKTGSVLTKTQIGITHATIGATSVADCNSATDANVEYYTSNSTENKPTDSGVYHVWAHRTNSTDIVQFASIKGTTGALWMRKYNGTWGAWEMVTRPLDVYPIGSIYQSTESTNPAHYFGGTWTQISAVDTCTLTATKVVAPSSRMYAELFTLAEVKALLNTNFGIDAEDVLVTNVSVSASDNFWNNGNVACIGVFWNPTDSTYYAYFSGTTSLNQQLQYTITFNREMYKFVRTA